MVDLLVGLLKAVVHSMEFGALFRQVIVSLFDAQQGVNLGQQFPGIERAMEAGVRAQMKALRTRRPFISLGDKQDRHISVGQPAPHAAAELHGLRLTATSLDHNYVYVGAGVGGCQGCERCKANAMSRAFQEFAQIVYGRGLVGAEKDPGRR